MSTWATTSILGEVFKERILQDKKWGEQNHSPFVWLGILGEEYGEACRGVVDANLDSYREELIHTAAVCVSAIECMDRNTVGVKLSKSPIDKGES